MAAKLLAGNIAFGAILGIFLQQLNDGFCCGFRLCRLSVGSVEGARRNRLAKLMAPGATEVQGLLATTLPACAHMQPLVAATLAAESILIGAGEFRFLGASMLCSTAAASRLLLLCSAGSGVGGGRVLGRLFHSGVESIWRGGITALFALRLAAALCRLATPNGPFWQGREKQESDKDAGGGGGSTET